MLRSMFTAISALNLNQTYMDVIADNLANANTYGFKSSRVAFQDQLGQLIQMGSAPTVTMGGVNPTTIGLGARLGSISAAFTQGSLQSTGRNTDLAINGSSFFIYSDGTKNYYSRDGSLAVDADGNLVNASSGARLMGWQAITSGSAGTIDTGQPLSPIHLPIGSTLAMPTTEAELGGNLDSTTANGASHQFTVGAYDSLGVLHSITLTFQNQGNGSWNWAASGDNVTAGSGSVNFDQDGHFKNATGSTNVTITGTNGAADTSFSVDMSKITQLASGMSVAATSQNGIAPGTFTSFNVSTQTGEIYGLYSNGMSRLIGQIAVANFVNPSGLVREGQNMFLEGLNSGQPMIGAPNTGERGSVVSGYLEGSNVDMAQEFTNMILAQRSFQASSRVITTSDEMLQELVNLKR
jgi:flagellar hook protein FlgE